MVEQSEVKNNRWLILPGAFVIQLVLGSLYAWSVFTYSFQQEPYNFSTLQIQAIFSGSLASFTLSMIFKSTRMNKIGFKPFLIAGGLALGGGYILGSQPGSSFFVKFMCLGVLSGLGIGFAYGVPNAICIKWFPDKKSLISVTMAAAFGFGTILLIQIGGSWFELVENLGVDKVCFYYGITFGIIYTMGSIVLMYPPKGYLPIGYDPEIPTDQANTLGKLRNYTWQKMLNKPVFWFIWLIFVISETAGFIMIGSVQLLGIEILNNKDNSIQFAKYAAYNAMASFALFNIPGVIAWDIIGKKLGISFAIFSMTFIQGVLFLTFFAMVNTPIMFVIYASAIGFVFGGNFTLFHTATASQFGTKNLNVNYLFVLTALGIAGIVGPVYNGYVRDNTGSFFNTFLSVGVLCIIGSFLAFVIKKPTERRTGGRRKGEKETDQSEDQNMDTGKRKILGSRKSSDRRIEKGVVWSSDVLGHLPDIPD
ncbi:MAG: MFS transporter [Candidatus Latescibacteria bacterium]|nr:MFS transporter [Candidatus Latescibacterota bacterium]